MTDTDFRAMAAFRHALRRFFAFSEEVLQSVGLTPQQYQALLAIRAHVGPEPMTVGTLATRLFIRHHSAVGLVDRLEARGFVERRTAEHDRRLVCLDLTLSGRKALTTLAAAHRAELMRLRPEVISLLESLG